MINEQLMNGAPLTVEKPCLDPDKNNTGDSGVVCNQLAACLTSLITSRVRSAWEGVGADHPDHMANLSFPLETGMSSHVLWLLKSGVCTYTQLHGKQIYYCLFICCLLKTNTL